MQETNDDSSCYLFNTTCEKRELSVNLDPAEYTSHVPKDRE